MAIENLGIYPNQQGAPIGWSLRVFDSDGTVTPSLRFETMSKNWTSADISVTLDVITKSGTEELNGYTYKGSTSYTVTTVAGGGLFAPTSGSDDEGYLWSVPLSSITGLSSLMGTLSYAARSYDNLRLTFSITAYYTGGQVVGQTVCYIGFIPEFTATEIYYDKNGLTVVYSATGDGTSYAWNRPNDRWAVQDVTDLTNVVIYDSEVWGQVGSAGKLTIPKENLRYIPKNGDTLTGNIRVTGSWMGQGTALGYIDLSVVTVTDKYVTKKPTLTLAQVADGIKVTVGQTGTGSDLDEVEVSLVGSIYPQDRAVIALGGSHVFPCVPYGVSTTWEGVGYSSAAGELAASTVVSGTISALDGNAVAFTYDDGSVYIPYNIKIDTANKPEYKTVKFAGRLRPTVGFGIGGTQTWRVAGLIFTSHTSLMHTTEQSVRDMPERGVCIMRLPDGQRSKVYVSQATVQRAEYGGALRQVSIDAEEVA